MRLPVALLLVLLAPAAAAVEVLASVRPLALIAAAVAGPDARVATLLPPGASAHHYQLRPGDRVALARADLVLWVGPAHEAFLIRVLAGSPRLLTTQQLPGMRLLPKRRPDGGRVLAGTVDAHVWLDAGNAAVIARAVAEALAARDPAHAGAYRRNAEALAGRLRAWEAAQAQRFARLPARAYLAWHDAYQYLEPGLGLEFRGSVLSGDEDRPGARHVLLLSERVRREELRCLLGEPGFDPALARQVFRGHPARLVSVDEVFAAAPLAPGGFEAGLARLADDVHACLGGR